MSPPPSQTSSPVGHEPTFPAVKPPVRPSVRLPRGQWGTTSRLQRL